MLDAKTLTALYSAVGEAEHALARVGADLTFQVKPEGGLEVVRRGPDGLPAEPQAPVADLAGADPLLWQAKRPEGELTMGRPYRDPKPRCAITGRPLLRGSLVDLYYRGQPVDAEPALTFSPRLVFLQSLMVFLGVVTYEVWARLPPKGEADENQELEAAGAAAKALWEDLLARLQTGLSPDSEPAAAEESQPEAS